MGETEDLLKNTSGTVESPEHHNAGSTKNPIIDDASSAENHVNTGVASAENLVNKEAVGAENLNKEAAGAENPVNKEAADAENPAKEEIDGAVNPVNVHAGGVESSVNNQANGAENPATDQSDNVVNLINDQVVNLIKDQTGGAENTTSDQSDNVVNLINDQPGGAENPPKDQAAGAENLVKDQEDAKNLIKDQVGGVEDSSKDQVSGAENPINHKEDEAGNSVEGKAGSSDKAITSTICDIENSAHDQEVATEIAVDDKACGIDNPASDKAGAVENPVNDKSGAVENPLDEQVNAKETPVNKADCLPQEAKETLKSLANQWEDVLDANALQVIPLKGAMTNVVFQIKWATIAGETSRKVLVRIYGEGVDIFFDRNDEIRTFEFMSKHGQGPRLLGRFANGRVEEFIHARTLSTSDLRDPSISALIATKMKEFHELDMPGEKKVYLWDRLRKWLAEAKRLSSPKEVEAFYLDTIDKEIFLLESELSSADQRIGFCHNDLQYGNIMLDEETNVVTIIDYEYASYNPVAYDIANHFCEMTANYHTETPHILDFSKYPDVEERKRFVQAYLSSSGTGEQPKDSEVEQLLQEIEKYTLANHLFWGVWGIISAQVNKIDFDYKEYAKQRFQEYWARKPYLLSYDAPSPYNAPEDTGELATASTTTNTTKAPTKNNIFRKMKRVLGLSLFRSKN